MTIVLRAEQGLSKYTRQLHALVYSLTLRFRNIEPESVHAEAYEQGYRLNEIAAHLGVHYATVSRRLKRIEQAR